MAERPQFPSRGVYLAAAVVVAVACAGYFTGLRQSPVPLAKTTERTPAQPVEVTPGYGDLRGQDRGLLGKLHPGQIANLTAPPSASALSPADEASFLASITARAKTRAYAGAPPSIPHRVDDTRAPDCLVCHQDGANIAGKLAPKMSHQRYDSCLQCHTLSQDPRPGGAPGIAPDNSFSGLASPGHGARAWPTAPPTMPHKTRMREQCNSCHGPTGDPGLRTSHPDRQSCVQCHATSAALDQRPSRSLTPTGAQLK